VPLWLAPCQSGLYQHGTGDNNYFQLKHPHM
jgi:hypothetical protein